MKDYELTVLIHPDLEADLEKALKKVRAVITDNGGKIIKEDNWGKKRLAYSIVKQDFAIYVYFDVSLPADAPQKISNTFNISDEVIRYLLVKVDEKGRRALAEAEKASKESEEEKEEE